MTHPETTAGHRDFAAAVEKKHRQQIPVDFADTLDQFCCALESAHKGRLRLAWSVTKWDHPVTVHIHLPDAGCWQIVCSGGTKVAAWHRVLTEQAASPEFAQFLMQHYTRPSP